MQFSTTPSRDVVRCNTCGVVQYLTACGQCARCHQSLGVSYITLDLRGLIGDHSKNADDPLRKSLGAALREMLTRRKITQTALSRKISIGRSHLSRIESGRVFPPVFTFLLIATWLGAEGVTVRIRDSPA
jgi:DNA-binding XRE family transcriptional regulator